MNKHIHGILSFFFSEKKIIINFKSKYVFKNNNISISVLDGMFWTSSNHNVLVWHKDLISHRQAIIDIYKYLRLKETFYYIWEKKW